MNDPTTSADWDYRTLLIIWTAILATQLLMVLCLYMIKPEIFQLDLSQPFIGEHYILVPAAILLVLLDLTLSYRRSKAYLRQSIIDKNPDHVRTALILAVANTASIGMYGFLLAWFFDYAYFYIWVLVGLVATLFYYPRRSSLAASRI